jgi:cell wall-associated NlpC family hydrolase
MTYQPMPGDFGVTQIRGVVGRLIRFGQWLNGDGFGDYEHAFVYVGAGEIVEAEPGGALLSPLSRYDGCDIQWYPVRSGNFEIVRNALALVGTPYSFADYFALAAMRFHLWPLSRWLRGYVRDSGHMMCSQLVDECYRRAGVHLYSDGRAPGDVTPGDLYRLIRQ